jgi:hypothetical protein
MIYIPWTLPYMYDLPALKCRVCIALSFLALHTTSVYDLYRIDISQLLIVYASHRAVVSFRAHTALSA